MKRKLSKAKSTYDEFMQDEEQRVLLEAEYRGLLISEFMRAVMAKNDLSVRRLSQEIGISPTIVQELRTGKRANITLDTFSKIVDSLGYQIVLEPKGAC